MIKRNIENRRDAGKHLLNVHDSERVHDRVIGGMETIKGRSIKNISEK